MRCRSAVAIFAAVLGNAAFFKCLFPVRAFFPTVVDCFVTGFAGFRPGIFGGDSR